MLSRIEDVVFREPAGGITAVVWLTGALAMASVYVYYGLLRDGSGVFSLGMAVGFAFSGVAESLPATRRRTAGGARVVALLVFGGLLGLTVFAPEVVFGPS